MTLSDLWFWEYCSCCLSLSSFPSSFIPCQYNALEWSTVVVGDTMKKVDAKSLKVLQNPKVEESDKSIQNVGCYSQYKVSSRTPCLAHCYERCCCYRCSRRPEDNS